MLVLDIADDHFDDILMGDETVGSAIFVDDESHLRAGSLHAAQQIGRQHGRRHEEQFSHEPGFGNRLLEIDPA
ncbi:hypothetical protein D3C73_808380 [compost metagenome]